MDSAEKGLGTALRDLGAQSRWLLQGVGSYRMVGTKVLPGEEKTLVQLLPRTELSRGGCLWDEGPAWTRSRPRARGRSEQAASERENPHLG